MANLKMRTENAAQLAGMLAGRILNLKLDAASLTESYSDTVLRLQRAARTLHRNAERSCNEDTGCSYCDGNGFTTDAASPEVVNHPAVARKTCWRCGGTGSIFGKREARLMERLRAALAPYRVRLHEQGDCRGWPLYLVPLEIVPPVAEIVADYRYPSDPENVPAESLISRWIASNYNRGCAVCPH